MNVRRVDLGKFTFFVNVFLPAKRALYHHGHEDLLSYVVFLDTREILIDPGRPSYAHQHDYLVTAAWHNGISDPCRPLRPRPRFYTPPRIFSQPASVQTAIEADTATFAATNDYFGITRTLRLEYKASGTVQVTERLEGHGGLLTAGFTHVFSTAPSFLPTQQIITAAEATRIAYSCDLPITTDRGERSTGYGRTAPCFRARRSFAPCRALEITWEISDVGREARS